MELVVKVLECLKYLLHVRCWVDQVCDSEVVCAFLLAEAATWHRHNTCLIYHLHAVNEVRLFALSLGILDKLLREMYLREPVHCSLNLSARYLLHIVEGVG